MFALPPKQISKNIIHIMSRGLTPLITSSPGVGKSSIVQNIAKTYGFELIDLRLSQCTPEDLQGYPMRSGNKATFTPFDVFPLEGEDIPANKQGWILFLDELTSATKPVQAAAYKLILDRMVGSYRLHPNVAIVAAGNRVSDKAVVNAMSTALQSRLIHLEMETSLNDWMDYAVKADLDHRVRGFLTFQPSRLMDFRPDHQDKTFPCPRTWEFLSRLVKDTDVDQSMAPMIAGTVGQGAAVEFITFAQEYTRLPKMSDILAMPKATPVPDESSTKYAVISMLIDCFDIAEIDAILTYTGRFPIELQIIFARGIVARNPDLWTKNKTFQDYAIKMRKYLQ
jgi:hypothetical protein